MRVYPLRLSSNTDELILVVNDSGTDSVGDPFLPLVVVPQFATIELLLSCLSSKPFSWVNAHDSVGTLEFEILFGTEAHSDESLAK